MRTLPLLLPTLLALSSCGYVSRGAYNDKLCEIDADIDGFTRDCGDPQANPATLDCNDQNASISPEMADIPYDGIDQNCDGVDLVDADDDGAPGVRYNDYLGKGHSNNLWPSTASTTVVDCDDTDAAANPLTFDDPPYDGIDGDCGDRNGETNDWDVDRDGYLRRPDANVDADADALAWVSYVTKLAAQQDGYGNALYTEFAAIYGPSAQDAQAYYGDNNTDGNNTDGNNTDCNDDRQDVNPGSDTDTKVDPPYNGHDDDCDKNNDFDVDGDDYAPLGYASSYASFVSTYNYPDVTWFEYGAGGFDCLDQAPDPALHPPDYNFGEDPSCLPDKTTAKCTKPGAIDDLYDGFDTNCDDVLVVGEGYGTTLNHNDFDDDGDGMMAPGYRQPFINYVDRYQKLTHRSGLQPYAAAMDVFGTNDTTIGAYYDRHNHDCNDFDSFIYPGQLEVLGNGINDDDCANGYDLGAFDWGDRTVWAAPGAPRVGETSDHYLIALTYQSFTPNTGTVYQDQGTVFAFPKSTFQDGGSFETRGINPYDEDDHYFPKQSQFISQTNGPVPSSTIALVTGSDSSEFWVAHSTKDNLVWTQMERNTNGTDPTNQFTPNRKLQPITSEGTVSFAQVDMRQGLDGFYAVGCGERHAQWFLFADGNNTASDNLGSYAACFVETPPASNQVQVYLSDGVVVQIPNPDGDAPPIPPAFDRAHSHDGWAILDLPGTDGVTIRKGSTSYTVLSGKPIVSVDASWIVEPTAQNDPSARLVVAAALNDGQVLIAYGKPDNLTITETQVEKLDNAGALQDVSVEQVAVQANTERVLVVVTGQGPVLGENDPPVTGDVMGYTVMDIDPSVVGPQQD